MAPSLSKVSERFPDHKVSVASGLYSITPEWSWLKGKPKRFGHFFVVQIDARKSPYTYRLVLANKRANSILLFGGTYAIIGVSWGEWGSMIVCLAFLFAVVGWHFRRERAYYREQARLAIQDLEGNHSRVTPSSNSSS